MSANPPVEAAPKASVLSVSLDVLKLAVATIAGGPGGLGIALVQEALGHDHPVLGMVAEFGIRTLAKILPTLGGTEITDDELAAALAKDGWKAEPYDPLAAFRAGV